MNCRSFFGPRAVNKIHNPTRIYYFYDSSEGPMHRRERRMKEKRTAKRTRSIEDCSAESFSFAFRSTFGPEIIPRPSSKVAGSFLRATATSTRRRLPFDSWTTMFSNYSASNYVWLGSTDQRRKQKLWCNGGGNRNENLVVRVGLPFSDHFRPKPAGRSRVLRAERV